MQKVLEFATGSFLRLLPKIELEEVLGGCSWMTYVNKLNSGEYTIATKDSEQFITDRIISSEQQQFSIATSSAKDDRLS